MGILDSVSTFCCGRDRCVIGSTTDSSAPLRCLPLKGFGDVNATDNVFQSFLHNLTRFNPVLHLPSFLIGILCCRLYRELTSRGSFLLGRGYLLYGPSLLVLCVTIRMASQVRFPLMHNGLLTLPGAGMILGLALGDRYLCKLLSFSVLEFLGKASYAEYMLHLPLRLVFENFVKHTGTIEELTYLVLVLALSSVVYVAYEEPMRRYLRSRFSRKRYRNAVNDLSPKMSLGLIDINAVAEQA
jgi:peptidoglycan/LPS O-acetylase OafA/YrhL